MSKTKVTDKSSKKDKKSELSSVKAGRVTKPSQTPKAKSKDVAKSVASSVKDKKKTKKAPTPEPESESSESESESDEESSASSSDEEVVEKTPAKAAPKAAAKADSSNSDSSDSSEEDSDSESEEEKPAAKAKANGVKTNGAAKAAAESDSDDSDSDSDSSASEDEKPAAKAKDAESGSDSESDSESGSDSDSSESEEEEAPSKKRKAEEVTEPVVKKTKTEDAEAGEGIKNLFVGSLSWNVDEDWLQREFEKFGEIVGCRVITDRESGRSKGFGYVEFSDAAAAAKAQAEMHQYELDGRQLNVDFSTPRQKPDAKTNDRANRYGDKRSAPSNTLFLGNLSFDCTNEGIQEIFAEYGSITRVSLPTDRESGSLKGFGYVDFATQEEATAALEALNGQDIEGRNVRIDYAAAREDNGSGGRGGRGGFGGGRGGGRGGFGDRGGRGGRGGFGGRGGRGGARGGRGGGSFNRGGFNDFQGSKKSFD